MKRFFLICLPFLISACSFRPDRSVVYGSEIPGSSLKVIYDQRVPDFMGGEEYVDVEFQDGSRHRIDNNGRYSEWLRVDVSGDARWYRLYMKNRYRLVGHTVYRDVYHDGDIDRVWISENEAPARALPHPYMVLAYLDRKAGKVYRGNGDFGSEMGPGNDHFGAQTKLETPPFLSKKGISWKRMERQ